MSDELSPSIEDDMRALEGGWCSTPCRCGICGHKWMAVWPIDLDRYDINDEEQVTAAMDAEIPQLQCSQCGQQGHTIEKELSEP
ncbi:hypothetical protein EON83_12545 [bacterium]|nr:MAG: hypothetical protein EON83_12545 [bacterium]